MRGNRILAALRAALWSSVVVTLTVAVGVMVVSMLLLSALSHSGQLSDHLGYQRTLAGMVSTQVQLGSRQDIDRLARSLRLWEENSERLRLAMPADHLEAFEGTEVLRAKIESVAAVEMTQRSRRPAARALARAQFDGYVKAVSDLNKSLGDRTDQQVMRLRLILGVMMALLVSFTLFKVLRVLEPTRREIGDLLAQLEHANDALEQQNVEMKLQQASLEDSMANAAHSVRLQEVSRLRFEGLFSAIPTACLTVDRRGEIQEWNGEATRLWGIPAHQAVFRMIDQVFAEGPFDYEELVDVLEGGSFEADERHTSVQGISKKVSVRMEPLMGLGGEVVGVVVACGDQTERLERDRAMRLQAHVIEQMAAGVLVTDANEQIVFCNSSFERITGFPKEAVLGKRPGGILQGPETDAETKSRIRSALIARQPVNEEVLNYRADGTSYWIRLSISPVTDRSGEVTHFVATEEDITEARRVKQELADSETLFRTVNEALREGIVAQDHEGKIIMANEAACVILGLTMDQLMGRTSVDSRWQTIRRDFSDLPGEEHPAMKALQSGLPVLDELMGVRHPDDGETRWIAVNSIPIRKGGVTDLVISSFIDVSERLAQDDQIAAHVAELTDMAAMLEAHRIELERANRSLENLARQDGLTGVANRRSFDERLAEADLISKRTGSPYALILMDVDHFKAYNDRFGHQAGDEILRRLGELLSESVRPGDVVARYGGEEFAVVLGETDEADACSIAERIRIAIESSSWPHRAVTVSVGVAVAGPIDTPSELTERADQSLYHSKAAGRNRVTLWPGEGSQAA